MVHHPKLYLICYDICGAGPAAARRLRKIYRLLRGYGEHLQYSIFRCTLTDRQLASLEGELEEIIDHSHDQVMVVPLGHAASANSWRMYTIGVPFDAPERVVRVV